MFTILRINTATGKIKTDSFDSKEYLLGGRTLSSRLISREVPLSTPVQNKLFFCRGVLSGTIVSISDRLSIGGKSPLTGGIKESNAGGIVGVRTAQHGLRCIALEDAPKGDAGWKIVVISKDKTEFVDGEFLAGKGVYEKSEMLNNRFGVKAGCVTIGPTAEKLLYATGIACSDPHGVCSRYAGRGGLGAA